LFSGFLFQFLFLLFLLKLFSGGLAQLISNISEN